MEDHWELTQKVRTSFKVPMAWYWAEGGKNDYSTSLALKCIGKDRFLPPLDPRMSSQDYHLGQSRKTLAYAKVLQYWVERVKPLIPSKPDQLAGSIQELRQTMELLMTFQDSEVLSDDTIPHRPEVCCSIWVHPRGSFSVAYSGWWPGPSIGQVTQTSMPATPLEKPSNVWYPLNNPLHVCQDWKRVQGNSHEPLLHWHLWLKLWKQWKLWKQPKL